MKIHTNCRNFRGNIPCRPHKEYGVHCDGCRYYDPIQEKILIIKLGAIGDVIRTTPLLTKLYEVYPQSQIHWLTHTPEILPSNIDRIYKYNLRDIEIVKQIEYDLLLNLDKDREACALANAISAKLKKGFSLVDGHCSPMDESARPKWITGLFDDKNRENTKSYPEEIFLICGFKYNREEYILEVKERQSWNLTKGKTIIGLNTGCGLRWKTRLWPESHWIRLAELLMESGYDVLFIGGEQEDEKNTRLAKSSGAKYLGHFRLALFVDLMNQCDLIVTAVTMALHISLGLKKKVILFNNIFNKYEFELFGRGKIIEPPTECKGCFMNECDKPCMELIYPEEVFSNIQILLK